MAYNFNAVWCKGTNNKAPDALSQSPVREPQPTELLAEYEEESVPELSISEIRAVSSEGTESIRLSKIATTCSSRQRVSVPQTGYHEGFS